MIKNLIPILQWLPNYKKEFFRNDVFAGLTVGIVLIPQGMAYALIAGLPPVYGLYAALMPQVIYAIFGTSRQLAVGPVAMDSLLVAAGLTTISVAGSEHYIEMAILLAFLMGAMQLLFGVFRLGFLVNFLSKPVISGFTSAAAIIIGLNQLKYLIGIDIARSNHVHEILIDAFSKIGNIHFATFLIGILGMGLILVIKKVNNKIPASLIVVVLSILAVQFTGLAENGVSLVGVIPEGLPHFSLPNFDNQPINELLSISLTLALIAFMEAISIAKALEEKYGENNVRANQELIALGAANIGGSLFQSYPSTGGFSRSAVNSQAGAKTGVAAIISALVVGLTLLFITSWFYYLPKAILASIIMVAVFGLIDFKFPKKLWSYKRDDLLLLIITFIITLTVGIKDGILIGVLPSLGMLIYRSARPHIAQLGNFKGTQYFRNINRFKDVEQLPEVLIFRFDGQLYFANCNYFRENLFKMADVKGESLKLIILDSEAINHLDSSAVIMLESVITELKTKGVQFYMADVIGPVRDVIVKSGLISLLGENSLFIRTADALDYYKAGGISDKNEQYKFKDIANQCDSNL
ncbi:MAG: solute carrier family 26 protein [Flavobacteriales bacterium]|nr:solute carrier family 26 protein [Flavobacteriales bacterium]